MSRVMMRIILGLALVFAGGCTLQKSSGTVSVASPDFFGFSDYLARQLVANRVNGNRVNGERIILTSMVSLDDLYETSAFGRTMTESLSTTLFKYGFRVAEIRKAPSVFVRSHGGELVLSRDVALLAESQAVHGIISGTYSLTPTTVIINVRLLDATSQEVLSVAGMELERSRSINYLLTDRGDFKDVQLSAYER